MDANTFPFLNGIAHFLPNAKLAEGTQRLDGLEAEFRAARDMARADTHEVVERFGQMGVRRFTLSDAA